MATDTYGKILFQIQLVLRQLATKGTTTRSREQMMTLTKQVDKIHLYIN